MKAEESSSTTTSAKGSSLLSSPRKFPPTAFPPLVPTTQSLCASLQAISALALVLTLVPSAAVYGACAPSGTNQKDTIVCNDADTLGVAAKSGNDSITVSAGASVSVSSSGSATAIDAGTGNDTVVNNGRVAVTINSNLASAPSSACPTASSVQGVGIAGGGGNDQVTTRGTITTQTTTTGAGSACRGAVSVGVLGNNNSDQIENSGSIAASASGDTAGVPVTAKGVAGGNGNDTITNTNTGTITVAAASNQKNTQSNPFTSSSQDSADNTIVTAKGIEGGSGKDELRNDGAVTADASAKASSVTPTVTLLGGKSITATTTLDARATGIDTAKGKDNVTNTGSVTASANAEVSGVTVSVTLVDLSRSNTTTNVLSTATGVDVSANNNDIFVSNTGTIAANAFSKSSSVGVEVNGADAATGDSALTVQSTATGIAGGRGMNTIDTSGAIKAAATSQSSDVSVNVSYVDATIADRTISNTSTTLNATAIGIDGTAGTSNVNVMQFGSVEATANANARALGVSFSVEGVTQATEGVFLQQTLASAGGITANSSATGLAGGAGDDRFALDGNVTAAATSTAHHDNIGIGM